VLAPIHAVAEYRLSLRTRGDLVDIYMFSQANFGRYQADAYYAGLERTFGLIADFPGIGINSDELVVGFRRFRFQSHYVFYSEEAGHVLIRALIHVRQSLRPSCSNDLDRSQAGARQPAIAAPPRVRDRHAALAAGIAHSAIVFCQDGSALMVPNQRLISP
jgi:toxin ParE1/3/4